MPKKMRMVAVVAVVLFLPSLFLARETGQDQIEKPKIFRDSYPLVSETDISCSFFVLEEIPSLRIESADQLDVKLLMSDGDQFWSQTGAGTTVREGQVFSIVEILTPAVDSKKTSSWGSIGFRRGRARVVRVEGGRFIARIEKACGQIRIGFVLFPYAEHPPILGKDQGFGGSLQGGEVLTGRLVYFRDGLNQIGSGDWALIDIGREQGLQAGRQLTVFTPPEADKPARAIANVVVIDVGRVTATVKVLSTRDAIHSGNLVQVK